MEYLDFKTLQFTLISVFSAASIFLLLFQHKIPHIKGPFYWGISGLMLSIGMLLFQFQNHIPFLSYVLAGTVILLGWCLFLVGLWKFKNVEPKYWIVFSFPVIQLLQGLALLYVWPIPHIRMANYSFLVAAINVLIAVEFFKPNKKYLKSILYIGGLAFLFRVLIVLPRSIFSLITKFGDASAGTDVTMFLLLCTLFIHLIVFGVCISLAFLEQINITKKQVEIKNRLFNIIAHDLKGPVGNISEFLKIINTPDTISREEQRDILLKLEKLSRSTYELLNNLLLWSNSTKERFKPKFVEINVSSCIATNVELFEEQANRKNIRLVACNTENVVCYADHAMFHTMVRNLIANAIKFSQPGGVVSINCEQNKRKTIIEIKDEGIGFSKEKLEQFYAKQTIDSSKGTNDEMGTGIGLTICRDFAKINGGELNIESKLDKGSLVRIILPSVRSHLIA